MAPPAIVATVAGISSNSFCTLAEAETYLSARLNATAWTAAVDDSKNMALLEACRDLSGLGCWRGRRVNDTQALSWPRDYVPDPDNPDNEGLLVTGYQVLEAPFSTIVYYLTTIVPVRVKDAQIELALEYLRAGSSDVAGLDPSSNIKSEKVDVIETVYVGQGQRVTGLVRYPRVMARIGPLLEPTKIGMTVVRC